MLCNCKLYVASIVVRTPLHNHATFCTVPCGAVTMRDMCLASIYDLTVVAECHKLVEDKEQARNRPQTVLLWAIQQSLSFFK